ncbi:S1/P1 nuclease [Elaphomyces granulatus]
MRFLATAIAVTGVVHQAAAWGSVGHQTVAYLAFKFLSSDTAQYLENILTDEIGDAATWADNVRHSRPHTSSWHFLDAQDNPPQSCRVHYPDDCTNQGSGGCIVSAINNQTALFTSPDSSDQTREEALKFVMHFLGDIHQPLHVEGSYRGGNELHVCFVHACARNNLHSVWDKDIPHKIIGLHSSPKPIQEKNAAKQWADSLHSEAMKAAGGSVNTKAECSNVANPDSCSLQWAKEANAYVCQYVMRPGIDWLQSNDLSLEYYDGAKPIVEKLISQAGLRLAGWLEAMVAGSQSAMVDDEQRFLGQWEL